MTTETRYFRPRNWSKFQSRSNNSMAWVKLHTSLLQDEIYLNLTPVQRSVLHGVWMLCGVRGRPVPLVSSFCGRALNMRSQDCGPALEVLLSKEFIELCGPTQNLHDELPSPREEKKRVDKKERTLSGSKERRPRSDERRPETTMTGKSNGAEKPKRGTRLDPDWQPSAELIQFGANQGLPIERIGVEADKFRDYWHAKSGQAATKLDWDATFRNWLRNAEQFGGHNARRNQPKPRGVVAAANRVLDRGANPRSGDDGFRP